MHRKRSQVPLQPSWTLPGHPQEKGPAGCDKGLDALSRTSPQKKCSGSGLTGGKSVAGGTQASSEVMARSGARSVYTERGDGAREKFDLLERFMGRPSSQISGPSSPSLGPDLREVMGECRPAYRGIVTRRTVKDSTANRSRHSWAIEPKTRLD